MAEKKTPTIAILTSGGDSQGMNAALRGAVRMALDRGTEIYAICEGYDGLGGDKIRKMSWDDVGGILAKGGTMIGSARSSDFRTKIGRQKAAGELLKRGIDSLIVIGGDGSLTGADIFRQEWLEHVKAWLATQGADSHPRTAPFLRIVGLVGSIDNDMCGTDYTIGYDSALHRITEAVDAILSTAISHQRTFIVEVMGRNCGYLALTTAVTTGADYCFVPEIPPSPGWEARMCQALDAGRKAGKRCSLIIQAEGAVDSEGGKITVDYVKKVLEEKIGHDTRVTLLGHVQRGGTPSAFDRNMSSLMGAEAVNAIFEIGNESVMIGMLGNRIARSPLMECVARTRAVAEALAGHRYKDAMAARGEIFAQSARLFALLSGPPPLPPGKPGLRIGILNAGAASPGMNTAVRVAVRTLLAAGHRVYAIPNGFSGTLKGEISEFNWMTCNGWAVAGGSYLGANRKQLEQSTVEAAALFIGKANLQGLVMVGGYEGYQTVNLLRQNAAKFPSLNIPMICVPASISNSLPGTEYSIGADTALNNIMWSIDHIKQSAVSAQRVFIVEVMGSYCGYLAAMSGLAGGAEKIYLHEDGLHIPRVEADIVDTRKRFQNKKKNISLFIRNENASKAYTTDTLTKLFEEESEDQYDVRYCILGHIQQGGSPSPMDRLYATRLAAPLVDFFEQQSAAKKADAVCIGLIRDKIAFTQLADALAAMDPKWWMEWKPIVEVLLKSGPKAEVIHPRLQRAWTSSRFGGSGLDLPQP